jgi:hypothetical protein
MNNLQTTPISNRMGLDPHRLVGAIGPGSPMPLGVHVRDLHVAMIFGSSEPPTITPEGYTQYPFLEGYSYVYLPAVDLIVIYHGDVESAHLFKNHHRDIILEPSGYGSPIKKIFLEIKKKE